MRKIVLILFIMTFVTFINAESVKLSEVIFLKRTSGNTNYYKRFFDLKSNKFYDYDVLKKKAYEATLLIKRKGYARYCTYYFMDSKDGKKLVFYINDPFRYYVEPFWMGIDFRFYNFFYEATASSFSFENNKFNFSLRLPFAKTMNFFSAISYADPISLWGKDFYKFTVYSGLEYEKRWLSFFFYVVNNKYNRDLFLSYETGISYDKREKYFLNRTGWFIKVWKDELFKNLENNNYYDNYYAKAAFFLPFKKINFNSKFLYLYHRKGISLNYLLDPFSYRFYKGKEDNKIAKSYFFTEFTLNFFISSDFVMYGFYDMLYSNIKDYYEYGIGIKSKYLLNWGGYYAFSSKKIYFSTINYDF